MKLWVYGCSFSTSYVRDFLNLWGKTWYEYLAEERGYELENRAQVGHGVLSVISNILMTHREWGEDDKIIIEVPDIMRMDIPQIDYVLNIHHFEEAEGEVMEYLAEFLELNGHNFVEERSISMWNGMVPMLLERSENIHTFYLNYDERMDKIRPLLECDLIDWIDDNGACVSESDKHFSPMGAKLFYEYIRDKI